MFSDLFKLDYVYIIYILLKDSSKKVKTIIWIFTEESSVNNIYKIIIISSTLDETYEREFL